LSVNILKVLHIVLGLKNLENNKLQTLFSAGHTRRRQRKFTPGNARKEACVATERTSWRVRKRKLLMLCGAKVGSTQKNVSNKFEGKETPASPSSITNRPQAQEIKTH